MTPTHGLLLIIAFLISMTNFNLYLIREAILKGQGQA